MLLFLSRAIRKSILPVVASPVQPKIALRCMSILLIQAWRPPYAPILAKLKFQILSWMLYEISMETYIQQDTGILAILPMGFF
jgi:hypothetical protein